MLEGNSHSPYLFVQPRRQYHQNINGFETVKILLQVSQSLMQSPFSLFPQNTFIYWIKNGQQNKLQVTEEVTNDITNIHKY